MLEHLSPSKLERWAWPLTVSILTLLLVISPLNLDFDSVSYGDHASNSMLVAQAKSFSLLHGNYSRVGFYHPGPYFFQIMAFGEFIFYDFLRISNSPEAAHRLAIGVQNLVLVGLAYRLLRLSSGSTWLALVVSLLGLSIALDQAPVLTSLWPPHMYVVPSFLFTVSMCVLIRGDNRALPYFVFSGSVLVHGHASNLGIVPLMTLGTIAGIFLQRYFTNKPITPKAILNWLRPEVVKSFLVFVIFILPIVILTLLHWPGEIPKYFSQSGGEGNPLFPSISYVGQYWQGWVWFLLASVLGVVFFAGADRAPNNSTRFKQMTDNLLPALFGFAITSSAILFYAVKGIDDLSLPYIGIWYLGAIAGVTAYILIWILKSMLEKRKLISAVTVLICSIVIMNITTFRAPDQSGFNQDGPEMDSVSAEIQAILNTGSVRLDLDSEYEWTTLWPSVSGMMNRAQRQHTLEVCIEPDDWHVLFHRRGLCQTTQGDLLLDRLFVSTRQSLGPGLQAIADFGGLHAFQTVKFFRPVPLAVLPFDLAQSDDRARQSMILGQGWTPPSGTFVWQVGKEATLDLTGVLPIGNTEMEMRIISNLPPNVRSRTLSVRNAERVLYQGEIEGPETEHIITVPLAGDRINNRLFISVDEMYSPAEWSGQQQDSRPIGIGLRSIAIK